MNTLFDKIWDAHVVQQVEDGPTQLYIDRHSRQGQPSFRTYHMNDTILFCSIPKCVNPKTMRITVDGKLGKGVTAKDIALYMMSKMTTSGATGYFVEYAGEAVRSLTMEGRLTLCNLSIEMGTNQATTCSAFLWPFTNEAKARKSSIRPFVQAPKNT